MRYGAWMLLALCVLSLAAGCGERDETVTALPAQMLQPADSPVPTATPHTTTIDPTPVCPPARGVGTVSPAVSISSITFLVNGLEQVVHGDDMLQAAPGDRVQVTDAIICVGTFSGKGGEACVDFAPVDQSGQEIMPEHKGTHLVPVAPGLLVISDLDVAWTISEDWSGISAVLNHWTPENTLDLSCASGRCERDDRIMVEFHSPAAISVDAVEQVELLSTKLWDVAGGQVVRIFDSQTDNLARGIAFSPDGALLAAMRVSGQDKAGQQAQPSCSP